MTEPIPRFRTLTLEEQHSYEARHIRPSLVKCDDGNLVAYSDYAALAAENERRTEQLKLSMSMTDSCIENINRLTAENERLRKAGDAMAERINADGQPHLETDDWDAAKSGN